MAKKISRCWYCGKVRMELTPELGIDWLKCSNCGATQNSKPTELRHIALLTETYVADGQRHYAATPIRK